VRVRVRVRVRVLVLVLAMSDEGMPTGHVFLSYRREDAARADWLQSGLEAAGIRVWRDTADVWPGDDWRLAVRRAIADEALVFLACFSAQSFRREKNWQNDELKLAVEQMRLRPPDTPWLIPVRFDDGEIPDIDLCGGRTLRSIQHSDLFGSGADAELARLVTAIQRILGLQETGETPGKHAVSRSRWRQVAILSAAVLLVALAVVLTVREIAGIAQPAPSSPSSPAPPGTHAGGQQPGRLNRVTTCPHGRRAPHPETGIIADVSVAEINAQEICVSWLNPDDPKVGGFIISEYPETSSGDQEGSGAPYPTPALSSQLINIAAFIPSLRPRPGQKWEMCVTPIGHGVGKNGLYHSFDARQGCSAIFTWPSK
jgi:TIR domain